MDASQATEWQKSFSEKSHSFLEERRYSVLQVTDQAALKEYLYQLENQHSHIPDVVRLFEPSLSNLESLATAVKSATGNEKISGLLWGSLQAVFEVRRNPSEQTHAWWGD